MSEPTRHEPERFLCQRCNKPDAELFGVMISHDEGRWVSYEDYARLNAKADALDIEVKAMWKENKELRDRIDILTPPLWLRVMAWLVSFVGAFWLAKILFNWMHR